MKLHNAVDDALATGPFGDGALLAQDLDIWLRGLTSASLRSEGHPPEGIDLMKATSTERRCLFENWAEFAVERQATMRKPFDCVLIAADAELAVIPGVASGTEAETVRMAYAATDLGPFRPQKIADHDVVAVREAIALIGKVLPRLAANTIGLAPRLVKIHDVVPSMHLSGSPGFVYISDRVLSGQTWALADALLHETLHEKSNLLRKFRSLLQPSYRESNSATTFLPWSVDYGEERHFSTWRLLSACHVYVHLHILRSCLDLTQEAEGPRERALFMLEALRESEHRTNLDADGHRLHRFLEAAIQKNPRGDI